MLSRVKVGLADLLADSVTYRPANRRLPDRPANHRLSVRLPDRRGEA